MFKREDHRNKHKCTPQTTKQTSTPDEDDNELPSMVLHGSNPAYDVAEEDEAGGLEFGTVKSIADSPEQENAQYQVSSSFTPNATPVRSVHPSSSYDFLDDGGEATSWYSDKYEDEGTHYLDQSSITTTPNRVTVSTSAEFPADGDVEAATVTVIEHSTPETPKRTRQYKLSKRKCRKVDQVLQHFQVSVLSIEERKEVLSKSLESQEVVNEENVQSMISDALLKYLKSLYLDKKYYEFYQTMQKIFPVYDETISLHIAKFINIRPSIFSKKFQLHFQRGRAGRPRLSLSIRQTVLEMYVDHSILTVDRRNGRDRAKLCQTEYVKFYEDLTLPSDLTLEEETNKRGVKLVAVIKRVLTVTLRLQKKLFEKLGQTLSIGTICQNKPFFITYASEKEKVLCMCILCLNIREMFDSLMTYVKKIDTNLVESSITQYFMQGSRSKWVESGYWAKECCLGKCKDCKSCVKLPVLPSPSSDAETFINYFQFEKVERPYIKENKEMISKRCERIKHTVTPYALLEKLLNIRNKYLYHRYQIHQDRFLWPKILATSIPVFHLDYSENLQFTAKKEAQAAHFNKVATSLHCTVVHDRDENGEVLNKYVYHFSDNITHDASFTFCVIKDLIASLYPDLLIIRLKSDNCSTQYKCRHTFFRHKKLSVELGKIIVVYYGVAGHGKGLVDAMGGFGVKTPLRKAILLYEKLFYESQAMVDYLDGISENDNWFYLMIDNDKLKEEREEKGEFVVKGCEALHMMSYKPNGVISGKQNICICEHCKKGELYRCSIEPGRIFSGKDLVDQEEEEETNSSDDENEHKEESDQPNDHEQYELPCETYFDIVNIDSYVAIYADIEVRGNELFYLGKVLDKGEAVASEENQRYIKDDCEHAIQVGEKYVTIHYLEKEESKSRRGKIFYKELMNKKVYVLPGEIFYPCVPMNPDCTLDIGDYQFLSDCLPPRR